jgi:hypothetical protein
MDFFKSLSRYDTFQKSKEHVQIRTLSGATGACARRRVRRPCPPPQCPPPPPAPPPAPAFLTLSFLPPRPPAVSIAAGVLMLLLFISEVSFWRTVRVEDHLLVDASQGDREFDISMDITFHALTCKGAWRRRRRTRWRRGARARRPRAGGHTPRARPLTLPPLPSPALPPFPTRAELLVVAEDAKGVPYEESRVKISKAPWTPGLAARAPLFGGGPFGFGRGAAGADVSPPGASASAPGCRVAGTIRVRKVAGVFYVAAPRSLTNMDGRLAFTIAPDVMARFNASHTVNHLAFGPPFPRQVLPLDGVDSAPSATSASWTYHIKVVPTLYEYLYGSLVDSQAFSVSDFVQSFEPPPPGSPGGGNFIHPGAWFKYDFSPIMVRSVETRRSFLQFATSLCAILGGLFALSGILDQVAHRTLSARKSK